MNHYQILEIPQTASPSEVKKAYRRLAKKYHPDLNPSLEASRKIRLINDAWEILSDSTSRNLYDLYLNGVPVKTVLDEVTPQQKYRAEYLQKRKKAQEERIRQQIHYKQKFYRYFRWVNIICFVASLIYTIDYYFDSEVYHFSIDKIVQARNYTTYVQFQNGYSVRTSQELYSAYQASTSKRLSIHISAILQIPREVRIIGSNKRYHISDTFYVFNNAFSIIMFICSMIVVGNKTYTDVRLTFGLLSCMTLLWVLLFTIPYL